MSTIIIIMITVIIIVNANMILTIIFISFPKGIGEPKLHQRQESEPGPSCKTQGLSIVNACCRMFIVGVATFKELQQGPLARIAGSGAGRRAHARRAEPPRDNALRPSTAPGASQHKGGRALSPGEKCRQHMPFRVCQNRGDRLHVAAAPSGVLSLTRAARLHVAAAHHATPAALTRCQPIVRAAGKGRWLRLRRGLAPRPRSPARRRGQRRIAAAPALAMASIISSALEAHT